MNLRALDLNLLVVFDAIYTERNVTRAAEKIFLSQPATSNALTRLRAQLKDELFLRGPEGLRPMPRAHELAPRLHTILLDLQQTLEPRAFDPANSTSKVTISAVDYFTIVVAPMLMSILTREAPGMRNRIQPTAGRDLEALDHGDIDFATASFGKAPDRYGQSVLIEDNYSCLIRKGHPLVKKRRTLREFAQASHLLVSPRGDGRGFVDAELAKAGLTRDVGLVIDHFAAAPPIVAKSDLVLTAPTLVLKRLKTSAHVMFESPVEVPMEFRELDLIWHDRLSRHPALEWTRRAIERAARKADIDRAKDQ